MGPEAFAMMRDTCRSLRRQAGIGKPSNIAVEQSAGDHSPATAAPQTFDGQDAAFGADPGGT